MRCRRRQSSTYSSWSKIVASVALTFFAYLGFSVVTFTAGDLSNPARSLPRAMYPLGITAFVYVAVSLGVFGTLPVDEVIEHGDTALAEAARPVLGDAGFTIMAITALLATASSVNSNIFAAGNLTLALSELAQFPPVFGQPGRFRGTRGVTVVGVAGLRLRSESGSKAWLIVVTMIVTSIVLTFFVIDTARNAPETFTAMLVMVALAVVLDAIWKRVRPKRAALRRGSRRVVRREGAVQPRSVDRAAIGHRRTSQFPNPREENAICGYRAFDVRSREHTELQGLRRC